MKRILLDVLACPRCQRDLILKDEQVDEIGVSGQEIISGTLVCEGCSANYAIKHGVPCMLVEPSMAGTTQKGFTEQWKLKQSGKFNVKYPYHVDYDRWVKYLDSKVPIDFNVNDWALDAGCGGGLLTYPFADSYQDVQVIGLDFQNDIYRTAHDARNKSNVHFVHGDIMNPPFKRESIKLLMSHGVLHHTENTRRAFDSVSSLIMKDGKMSIWLYPAFNEGRVFMPLLYLVRDGLFLGKGHLLSARLRFNLSRLFAFLLLPLLILAAIMDLVLLQRKLKEDHNDSEVKDVMPAPQSLIGLGELLRTQIFVLYDNITPEYQFRHKRSEVVGWFERNGFTDVQVDNYHLGYYHGVKQ